MLEKKLNVLLANYEVMFHKLQTYHWYVKGATFFLDHEMLERYFGQALEAIDLIAEKLLMIGGKPLSNMEEILQMATIEEAKDANITQKQAYKSVREDFATLLEGAKDLKKTAEEQEEFLIGILADGLIEQLSKDVWMLDQALA